MPTRNESPLKPGRATGPRTPEGKARSSQNARKHGLTAHTVPLDPALRAQYDQLRKDYEDELGPRGPLEMTIFEELVVAAWQLERFARLEREIDLSPELLLDDAQAARVERLHRYHARARRAFFKCVNELRTLRWNRRKARALEEGFGRDWALICKNEPVAEVLRPRKEPPMPPENHWEPVPAPAHDA